MRVIAIAAGIAVAVAAALLLAAWLLVEPEDLRAPLEARLSEALGRPVAIGGLDLALLPTPALRAREVRLGPARRGAPPLALIEEVRLRLRLLPLLVGRVALGSVVVRSPRVTLPAGPGGLPELPAGATAPRSEPPTDADGPAAGAPLLAIDRIRVHDGRLAVGKLALEGIDLDGRLDAAGTATVAFAFDLEGGGPALRDGHADLEGLFGDAVSAEVRGRIEGGIAGLAALAPLGEDPSGELAGSFELVLRDGSVRAGRLALGGEDLSLATDAFALEGSAALHGEIGDAWRLELTDALLRVGDATKPRGTLLELRGPLPALPGERLSNVAVLLPGNRLEVDASFAGPVIAVSLGPSALELAPLSELLPWPAEGTVRIEGLRYQSLPPSLRGRITLDAVRLALERGPLELSGTLAALGQRIYTPELAIDVAEQRILASATYELSKERLALQLDTRDADVEALGNWLLGKTALVGRLSGRARGVVSLASAEGIRLQSGSGRFEVRPGSIRGFSLLREALGGLAELPLLVAQLQGRDLSRFEEEEFESLTAEFVVEGNALRFEDLVLVYRGGTASLRGSVGIDDGALDLSGELRFDRELADEVGGRGGQVVLPIAGIGGTVDRPRLHLEPRDLARAAALWAAQGRVRESIDEVLGPGGTEAVEGLLDQLLRGSGQEEP